jgi:phage terminase large subunit GpA-like protein
LLAENWTHDSGAAMPLARFALDTGFATQEAYAFVRACRDPRVMAVKGVPRGAALIGTPTAVDISQGGKLRRGIKVFRWRWASPSWSSTTTCARARMSARTD